MSAIATMSALSSKLEKLEKIKGGADESRLLQSRQSELDAEKEALREVLDNWKAFRDGEVILPDPPGSIHVLRKSLSKVRERFENEGTASSLTKRKDWENFLTSSRETSKVLRYDLVRLWKSYIENSFTGDQPQDIELVLARTDSNNRVLQRYRAAYAKYQDLSSRLPESKIDLDNIGLSSKDLSEIYSGFDFDVSESVKMFLDAIGSGGADLQLFTDEVREWLSKTDSTSRYRIVVRH